MKELVFSYEVIVEQTKMFKAAFGRNPKYIANISSSSHPEAAANMMVDNLYIGTNNADYQGCLGGLQYALEYGNYTPGRYIKTLMDGNIVTFFKYIDPKADVVMPFTQIGHCKCFVIETGPAGPMILFDSLCIGGAYYTEEDVQEIMRLLYIEAARFQLRHKKLPIMEIRYDFPAMAWNMEQNKFIEEFGLTRSMFSMGKVISNDDSEDRFAEDYNPLNIKMMRLLPTDIFSIPDSIVELLTEARHFMRQETLISRALVPTSEVLRKMTPKVTNDDTRRGLVMALCSNDVRHIVFFVDNEPIGILQYEQKINEPTHLHLLYIKEGYREKGYGSWIIQQFFAEIFLSKDSLPVVQLEIFIGQNALKLLQFYQKHGFTVYGQVFNKRIPKGEFLKLADAKE